MFSLDFEHSINNVGGSVPSNAPDSAQSSIGIDFTALVDTNYSIGGFYEVSFGTAVMGANFEARLLDVTASTILFQDYTRAAYTDTTVRFDLGTANDGNADNATFGSLEGFLSAGHEYHFIGTSFITSVDFLTNDTVTASSGSAFGQIDFIIGSKPISAVPLPATFPLFLSALPLLAFFGWLRKRATPSKSRLMNGRSVWHASASNWRSE